MNLIGKILFIQLIHSAGVIAITNPTIGLVQMEAQESLQDNLDTARQGIVAAIKDGAKLVCLQELVSTRYFCQEENYTHFEKAEPIDGQTVCFFGRIAKEEKITIVVPFFERRASGVYHNSAAVMGPDGSLLGLYRKMHIPDDPGFMEKFYFAPGDLGFKTISTPVGRIAVLICWDQWFPEAARLATLSGAEMIFYPTAIGWSLEEPERRKKYLEAWKTVMRGHAVANGCTIAAVNRVGQEGELNFWGNSFIAGPLGEWIAQANQDPCHLTATLDLKAQEIVRREWPFLRDRRIDAYAPLQKRFIDETD
ncbi:MAG: carbon-nitrogen hydrolase [Myxococcota bacterium]|nr:carbon-nitrogen hydrolase [Myxococcota bacterium]